MTVLLYYVLFILSIFLSILNMTKTYHDYIQMFSQRSDLNTIYANTAWNEIHMQ